MESKVDWEEAISRCVRCGRCRSVCPTFSLLHREWAVARGRIALLEALEGGRLEPTGRLEDHLSTCLLCMACEEVCTNKAPVVDLVEEGRAILVEKRGKPLYKRILAKVLEDKALARRLVALGLLGQPLWGREVPQYRGLALRIPILKGWDMLPPLVKPFSREGTQEWGGGERGTVALFLGCLLDFSYPSMAQATVDVLVELGYRVVVPHGQSCCGYPHEAMGDREGAERLKELNARFLEESGASMVVTACATCTAYLKKAYRLSIPVKDVVEVMLEAGGEAFHYGLGEKATYHEPCHLGRGQEVKGVWPFLKEILGPHLVEMRDFDRCCGFGGSLALGYPQVSLGVGEVKARAVEDTEASVVLTACPACVLQINRCLAGAGVSARAFHLVEALEVRGR